MRKLFKNSFFSFFKNKLAIALLIIIVFLTTATFTMFNSVTHAFKKSYDQVMTQGNRHDYTIKEMYTVEGDVAFQDPVKASGADATLTKEVYVVKDATADGYYKDASGKEYLAFKVNVKVPGGFGPDTNDDAYFVVSKDDLLNSHPTFYFTSIVDPAFGSVTVAKTKSAIDLSNAFKVDISKDTGIVVGKDPAMGTDIKITFNKTPAEIEKAYQDALALTYQKQNVTYQKYTFGIDNDKSGSIYQKLNGINNYHYDFIIPSSITNPDWTTQFIELVNSKYDLNKLSPLQDQIRSDLNIQAKFEMHKSMIDKIQTYPELIYKDVESVKISSNADSFKFVKETESEVDRIKIFEGAALPEPLTQAEMDANLKETIIRNLTKSNNGVKPDSGTYRAFFDSIDGSSSSTYVKFNTGWSTFVTGAMDTHRYIDPSSFAAVISPTYAQNKSISPMSIGDFNKVTKNEEFIDNINDGTKSFIEINNVIRKILGDKTYGESVLHIGETPYFVIGTGITPDFAFPIISNDSPIPDTNSQAIVYTNGAGYERIKQANAGSPLENYIALKFKDDVSKGRQSEVIGELDKFAQSQTSWPTPLHALEAYNSENETVLLSPSRITFLEKLNTSIYTVSWVVTSLLVLFTAFIVALVIKKQIDNRKQQLGILLANGYSKLEIASSMMIIGVIVAIIPAIVGYLVGHFMQFALMNIFHNYWTLPIWETQFSWLALGVTFIAPLAGMALLAFVISLWTLRGPIPSILNGAPNKQGYLTKQVMRPMKYFGIKTKMGISLVFSNIGKLTIALLAFSGSIIAMSVSMNSVGKFDYAKSQSTSATDYEYQVDLISPTKEAGLYTAQTIDSMYYSSIDGTKQPFSREGVRKSMEPLPQIDPVTHQDSKHVDHYDDAMFFHAASYGDIRFAVPTFNPSAQWFFPQYLKNRIQVKSLLNFNISGTTNPWQIASQMMPENQKNTADKYEDRFLDYAIDLYQSSKDPLIQAKFQAAIDKTKGFLVPDTKSGQANKYMVTKDLGVLKSPVNDMRGDFLDMYAYGIWQSGVNYLNGDHSSPLPYFMIYNNILVDKGDETYTYIDTKFNKENARGETKTQSLKIRGIDEFKLSNGKSQIHMSNASIDALKQFVPDQNKGVIPIVINKYFQEFYNMQKGDQFTSEVGNMIDRYIKSSDNKVMKEQSKTFQVVGIENTYNEGKIYTLQKYANDAIGLSLLEKDMDKVKPNALLHNSASGAFNGVMTREHDPLIFKSLPLYSPSGVYPGKNNITISGSGANEDGYQQIDKAYFNPDPNWDVMKSVGMDEIGRQHLIFPNPEVTNMQSLMRTYGNDDTHISPMQALYTTVDWIRVSDYQFTSIMDLSSALMDTVQIIVLFIALAFVLLISTMIIADNTRFIATLKVMGYRTKEISKVFLSTFLPSLVFALIVAIPLSFGMLEWVRVAIMGFGHVLIPLYLVGWEIVAAFAVLVIGFLFMYFISLKGLKNTSLLKAFSE